jgi:hypothetical protein
MTLKTPPKILLGPDGRPISSQRSAPTNTREKAPITGNAFGNWAGRDIQYAQLPGGGVVQFDLSKLTVSDFRNMRDHYQVNASLAVLSFMQHQSKFHIECEDKKIADFCDEQMHENWTLLNRAMSTSNWAGYSPNVLEWENDVEGRKVKLDKIKDLIPEECRVNWREVEGWAPPTRTKPKFKVYDGIKQLFGNGWPIPVDNTFWYPILMENGDYYGRKLLKPAFESWFFSLLIHLFSNRYYERFSEPTPVGRAPFDDQIETADGTMMRGNVWMLSVLQQLRNHGVVVLPNDKEIDGNGRPMWDYDIEYLESQMRGADFDRYLTRLDEEVSIALFTPILLLRTADVGSYNLGQGHMQLYLWMLNAMNADRKQYIDRYILNKMVDYNAAAGANAPRAKIVFEDLDNKANDVKKEIIVQLIKNGSVGVDLDELGQALGMTLKEIQQTTQTDPNAPAQDPAPAKSGSATPNTAKSGNSVILNMRPLNQVRATVHEVKSRVHGQVTNAMKENRFNDSLKISMGFRKRMAQAAVADAVPDAEQRVQALYEKMDLLVSDLLHISDEFTSSEQFTDLFFTILANEVAELA